MSGTASHHDQWVKDFLHVEVNMMVPGLAAAEVLTNPGQALKDLGHYLKELGDVVQEILHALGDLSELVGTKVTGCEGQCFSIVGSLAGTIASASALSVSLAADATPAVLLGLPATVVSGIALGGSIAFLVSGVWNLYNCIHNKTIAAEQQLALKQQQAKQEQANAEQKQINAKLEHEIEQLKAEIKQNTQMMNKTKAVHDKLKSAHTELERLVHKPPHH